MVLCPGRFLSSTSTGWYPWSTTALARVHRLSPSCCTPPAMPPTACGVLSGLGRRGPQDGQATRAPDQRQHRWNTHEDRIQGCHHVALLSCFTLSVPMTWSAGPALGSPLHRKMKKTCFFVPPSWAFWDGFGVSMQRCPSHTDAGSAAALPALIWNMPWTRLPDPAATLRTFFMCVLLL